MLICNRIVTILFICITCNALAVDQTYTLLQNTTQQPQNISCSDVTNQTCFPVKKSTSLNDQNTLPFYYVTIALTVLMYALVLPAAFKKSQPSSVFIFSLALADFFIGLVIVPIKITEVYGMTWQNDIVWCRVVNAVTLFGIALAGTNMVAVSLDRLYYFTYPLNYRDIVTIKKAIVACISVFVFSLPALLPAVGVGGQHTDQRLKFCAFKFSLTKAYMWAVGIVYFFVPTGITLVLQLRIMILIRRYYNQHRNFIQETPQEEIRSAQLKSSMKREMRVQKMFFLIFMFYLLCWTPFVAGIICNLVATHLITPFFIQLMRIMLFINSFVNPTIMFLSSENFLTRFMCCNQKEGRGRRYTMQTTKSETEISTAPSLDSEKSV